VTKLTDFVPSASSAQNSPLTYFLRRLAAFSMPPEQQNLPDTTSLLHLTLV